MTNLERELKDNLIEYGVTHNQLRKIMDKLYSNCPNVVVDKRGHYIDQDNSNYYCLRMEGIELSFFEEYDEIDWETGDPIENEYGGYWKRITVSFHKVEVGGFYEINKYREKSFVLDENKYIKMNIVDEFVYYIHRDF